MKLNKAQLNVLHVIEAVKTGIPGYEYCYNVPTSVRRSGFKKVDSSVINQLIAMGIIERSGRGFKKVQSATTS